MLRPAHHLDVTGLRCPVPVLMTARAMATLGEGERLDVVGDDPDMLVDLPAWCEQSGNRLLRIERSGDRIRATLEKATLPAIA